jgi:hypothetical protein
LTVSVEFVVVKRNAETRSLQRPDAGAQLNPREGMEIGIASMPVIRKRKFPFLTCAPA